MTTKETGARIAPLIRFERGAMDAAALYAGLIPGSSVSDPIALRGAPGGDETLVDLSLSGLRFRFLESAAGSGRNPSVSYLVACATVDEAEALWHGLADGAETLMPFQRYDFSERHGWLKDARGVSWQITVDPSKGIQKITPSLLFSGDVCGRAEEAMCNYLSIFEDSAELPAGLSRYGAASEPETEGTLRFARFVLAGGAFAIMDSAMPHAFAFDEAQAFLVTCATQDGIDYYWERLSAVPEAERGGWLKDEFGMSWRVVPSVLDDMLAKGTDEQRTRVAAACASMKKLDIETLTRAYAG